MPKTRADEKNELFRTNLKLEEARDELANLKGRYKTLYEKFEQTSVKHNADQSQLEQCQMDRAAQDTENKRLNNLLRVQNLEMERLNAELAKERRKNNELTIKLDELQHTGMSIGSLASLRDEPSESSTATDGDNSMEMTEVPPTPIPEQRPEAKMLQLHTPQRQVWRGHVLPAEGEDSLDVSHISPPPTGYANRHLPSPKIPNTSTPTETPPARPRMVTNSEAKNVVVRNKQRVRPPTVSFADNPAQLKRQRLGKASTAAAEDDSETDEMDADSQTLLSTTIVVERTIWTPPATDDFILIRIAPLPGKSGKVPAKAKPKHFVAKITGHRKNGELSLFRVQYFRKKSGRSGIYFVEPNNLNETDFEVEDTQVVASLPSPNEGRRGLLTFPSFIFDNYLMG